MAHPIIEAYLESAPGRHINPDGKYGNQCVDPVDDYAQTIFGVPWQQCVGGVGGARELLDVVPDEFWIRIDNDGSVDLIPERGDVLVYAGDELNEFGHTALTLAADPLGVDVVQQDGFAPPHQFVDGQWYSAKPAHTARLGYGQAGTGRLAGWLRPRPEKLATIKVHTTITKGALMALTDREQEELLTKVRELHRDYSQGIGGVRSDGDSFNLIRRGLEKLGVRPDEAGRRAKYGKRARA